MSEKQRVKALEAKKAEYDAREKELIGIYDLLVSGDKLIPLVVQWSVVKSSFVRKHADWERRFENVEANLSDPALVRSVKLDFLRELNEFAGELIGEMDDFLSKIADFRRGVENRLNELTDGIRKLTSGQRPRIQLYGGSCELGEFPSRVLFHGNAHLGTVIDNISMLKVNFQEATSHFREHYAEEGSNDVMNMAVEMANLHKDFEGIYGRLDEKINAIKADVEKAVRSFIEALELGKSALRKIYNPFAAAHNQKRKDLELKLLSNENASLRAELDEARGKFRTAMVGLILAAVASTGVAVYGAVEGEGDQIPFPAKIDLPTRPTSGSRAHISRVEEDCAREIRELTQRNKALLQQRASLRWALKEKSPEKCPPCENDKSSLGGVEGDVNEALEPVVPAERKEYMGFRLRQFLDGAKRLEVTDSAVLKSLDRSHGAREAEDLLAYAQESFKAAGLPWEVIKVVIYQLSGWKQGSAAIAGEMRYGVGRITTVDYAKLSTVNKSAVEKGIDGTVNSITVIIGKMLKAKKFFNLDSRPIEVQGAVYYLASLYELEEVEQYLRFIDLLANRSENASARDMRKLYEAKKGRYRYYLPKNVDFEGDELRPFYRATNVGKRILMGNELERVRRRQLLNTEKVEKAKPTRLKPDRKRRPGVSAPKSNGTHIGPPKPYPSSRRTLSKPILIE